MQMRSHEFPFRYKVQSTHEVATMRDMLHSTIKALPLCITTIPKAQYPVHAFVNGARAKWGDGFILLKLKDGKHFSC